MAFLFAVTAVVPSTAAEKVAAFDFRLGNLARVAITGEIQKVSALVLDLNHLLKGVGSKAPEQAFSIDLRGDTDESFDRAVKYVVRDLIVRRLQRQDGQTAPKSRSRDGVTPDLCLASSPMRWCWSAPTRCVCYESAA